MRGAAPWLGLALAGCTSAHFNVSVRDQHRRPIPRATALVYAGTDSDICEASPFGGRGTDAEGNAFIHVRGCGEDRLVVTADGYKPVMRRLDTCGDLRAGISIELEPRPPDPPASDEMIKTARSLVSALSGRARWIPLETLLANTADPTLYYEGGRLDYGHPRCDLHFVRTLPSSDPTVEFAFECKNGCRALWQVHMIRQGDEWRVRDLTPASRGFQPP